MKIFYYCFIGLFVITLSSCKKSDNPILSTELPKEIIPLSIGNSWTTYISYYDSLSNVQTVDTLTRTVESELSENDIKWFSIKFLMQTDEFSVVYRNAQEGFIRNLDKYLIYKYPASKYDTFPDPNGENDIVVRSIDTTIVTPAGTFSCYCFYIPRGQIIGGKPGIYYLDFVAPGIGFIKVEHYVQWSPGTYSIYSKQELVKYDIK